MTVEDDNCPFKAGDYVVYRPSSRGQSLEVMASPSQRLIPGATYKVKAIQKGLYVLVEGYEHPGGGLYWSEFESAKDASDY